MNEAEQQLQTEIIQRLNLILPYETSYRKFKENLIAYINELINQDFAKLISLLYRIDISEKKIKELLNAAPEVDAACTITELVIKRELQKIESRTLLKKQTNSSKNDEDY